MRDNRQTNEDRRTDEEFFNRTVEELDRRTVEEVRRDHIRTDQIMSKAGNYAYVQFLICVIAAIVFFACRVYLFAVFFAAFAVYVVVLFTYGAQKYERLSEEALERAERLERERAEQERIFEEAKGVNFDADINISVDAPTFDAPKKPDERDGGTF